MSSHNLKRRKYYFNQILDKIAKRNGTCLSSCQEYVNIDSEITVQCQDEHIFKTKAGNIQQGKWCRYCRCYIREHICRCVFEHIFRCSFEKSLPAWLHISPKVQLELDGYNKDLRVAFEVQGQQHYMWISFFDKTLELFKHRQRNDELKRRLCKEQGIELFEIPYTIPKEKLYEYIVDFCQTRGFSIDDNTPFTNVNYSKLSRLTDIKQLVADQNGELVEKNIDVFANFEVRCKYGHKWYTCLANLRRKYWCSKCADGNMSQRFKQYFSTDEGKHDITKRCVKRKATVERQNIELRSSLVTKICRICGIQKNVDSFRTKRDSKDGLRGECRECENLIKRLKRNCSSSLIWNPLVIRAALMVCSN